MNTDLKYKLSHTLVRFLVGATNRDESQTQELFNLCDGDFCKLFELEERIKNLHLSYCPSTKEEVMHVLSLPFDRKEQSCTFSGKQNWKELYKGKTK